MKNALALAGVAWLLAASGCGGMTRRPVLYPNDHLQRVGDAQAKADIATCQAAAKEYASSNVAGREMARDTVTGGAVGAAGGAVGGAIAGNPGQGAAIGAAAGATTGLLGSIFRGSVEPSAAYMSWVDECLREKGYRTVGWE